MSALLCVYAWAPGRSRDVGDTHAIAQVVVKEPGNDQDSSLGFGRVDALWGRRPMNARPLSSKLRPHPNQSQKFGVVWRDSRSRQVGDLLHRRRAVQSSTPKRLALVVDPRVHGLLFLPSALSLAPALRSQIQRRTLLGDSRWRTTAKVLPARQATVTHSRESHGVQSVA